MSQFGPVKKKRNLKREKCRWILETVDFFAVMLPLHDQQWTMKKKDINYGPQSYQTTLKWTIYKVRRLQTMNSLTWQGVLLLFVCDKLEQHKILWEQENYLELIIRQENLHKIYIFFNSADDCDSLNAFQFSGWHSKICNVIITRLKVKILYINFTDVN